MFNRISLLLAENLWQDLAESSSFLCHNLADLVQNHLATLAVSTTHSDCHVTMRTGQSMQRVKLVTRMPCPHTLWFSRCWGLYLTWGPALLKCCRPRATFIRHWGLGRIIGAWRWRKLRRVLCVERLERRTTKVPQTLHAKGFPVVLMQNSRHED